MEHHPIYTFGSGNNITADTFVSIFHLVIIAGICGSHPLLNRSSPVSHDGAAGARTLDLCK